MCCLKMVIKRKDSKGYEECFSALRRTVMNKLLLFCFEKESNDQVGCPLSELKPIITISKGQDMCLL